VRLRLRGADVTKKVIKNIPCEHWPNCQGCPLVNRPYPEQLKIKFEKVLSAFVDAGFSEKQVSHLMRPTRSSPLTLGYRNKAKWILEPDSEVGVRMGMYKPGTHDVMHMPNCAVHAPEINRVSEFIRNHLIEFQVPVGAHEGNEPRVRYLIVRYSFREKKLITVFVTSTEKVPGLEKVFAKLGADPEWSKKCVAIVQNINADAGNVLLGEANRYYKKSGELTETMGPFRVPVGPLSFLQVNSLQASYL
jgi:23S rRNA (uracil1939-C5)-methyltransferase